ncbi:hypothetical protein J2T13_001189 [Paenibacillus sp. DS2015]|uniref:hypothetical protein n=1 Tax=Paenibacillus sp. DS2015 TaxID=3373917 RepID=UPI003D24B065
MTLLEVKQKFIDAPDIFNSSAFKQAIERSGFEVDSQEDFTALTAPKGLLIHGITYDTM